jgi:divinyl chlorophyllide a 8-vinyl-reductase
MRPQNVALTGASGTIGAATKKALEAQGHRVLTLGREAFHSADQLCHQLHSHDASAVVSCMASRTGTKADAWRVDHQAQSMLLKACAEAGVRQFVLLSAICVQRPRLHFQHAKLAFEHELMASPLDWSIVRPTAFFKSLSGQLSRVQRGKPFLVFGDGTLTACKPIADDDLAAFLVGCLNQPERSRKILPVGGPGEALTPRDQAALLAQILGRPVRIRQVPPGLLLWISRALHVLGKVFPGLEAKAEYARIGHYYATESMLLWNAETKSYDADTTPSHGVATLEDHYRAVLRQSGLTLRNKR